MKKTFEKMSARTRRNVLAVIMLTVLVASTVVALAISLTRQADRPGETWRLLTHSDGHAVGWEVFQRSDLGDAGTTGYTVRTIEGSGKLTWSMWRLNPGATKGRYVSGVDAVGQGGATLLAESMQIDYADDHLAVGRSVRGRNHMAREFAVGDGYIPSGRLRTAIVQAARRHQPFDGATISDKTASPVALHMRPGESALRTLGDDRISLATVTVRWENDRGPIKAARYFVAPDGTIPIIENIDPGGGGVITSTDVGVDGVRCAFPQAHWRRNSAAGEAKIYMDRPPPPSQRRR